MTTINEMLYAGIWFLLSLVFTAVAPMGNEVELAWYAAALCTFIVIEGCLEVRLASMRSRAAITEQYARDILACKPGDIYGFIAALHSHKLFTRSRGLIR